ncbi:hypothetical protein BGZ98_002337 [Dissophora globulifera]|nr:hypothetical protein BGZ98_002337 [Dissophora globulifera]
METEYLDAVDKELHEIERFFINLYKPAEASYSTPHASCDAGLLPFLNFGIYKPPCPSSHRDCPSTANNPTDAYACTNAEADDMAKEILVSDLRERYRQLKIVQDQLRLELTRLRIWKLTRPQDQQPPEATLAAGHPYPNAPQAGATAAAMAPNETQYRMTRKEAAPSSMATEAPVETTVIASKPTFVQSFETDQASRGQSSLSLSSYARTLFYSLGTVLILWVLLCLSVDIIDEEQPIAHYQAGRTKYAWPRH